jgi:hypothetical protein
VGLEILQAGTKFPVYLSRGKQIVAKIAQPGNPSSGYSNGFAVGTLASLARAIEIWLAPFAALFTQPTWLNAVALATGALGQCCA